MTTEFHALFGVEEGRELDAFPVVLRRMLDFEEMVQISGQVPTDFSGSESMVHKDILLAARLHGSVPIPPEWTPDSFVYSFSSADYLEDPRTWWVYLREGMAFYIGQKNPGFDALLDCARGLFSRDDQAEKAAFYLYDEIGVIHHKSDFGGLIDGLGLLDALPAMHYRVERVLSQNQLLTGRSAAIRYRAAEVLDKHVFPAFVELLKEALCSETVAMVSEAQIRALRSIGGESGFNALLKAAQAAPLQYTRALAARALAWVKNYPEGAARTKELCRSKDSRTRSIGAAALAESRYHSIFAYGAVLASREERAGG